MKKLKRKLTSFLCLLLCLLMLPLPQLMTFADELITTNDKELEQLQKDMDYIKNGITADLTNQITGLNTNVQAPLDTGTTDTSTTVGAEIKIDKAAQENTLTATTSTYQLAPNSSISYTNSTSGSVTLRFSNNIDYAIYSASTGSLVTFGFNSNSYRSIASGNRITVTNASTADVTITCEGDNFAAEAAANPALFKFTVEPGKNYEIRNLSTTAAYTLNTDSTTAKRFDYAMVDANGNYSCSYSTYGNFNIAKGSRMIVNALGDQPITAYMPYESYANMITVAEVANPALYKFELAPGKSYEIHNLSTTTTHLLNNDSSSTKRYDYVAVDANGNYSYTYSTYGSLSLPKNSKIVINAVSGQPITAYMPYELYNSMITVAETTNPALYSFVMQPGKNYEIRNLSTTTSYSLNNDSSYSKKYAYSRLESNGAYYYGYSESGGIYAVKNSKTVVNGVSDQAITVYMPYELYGSVITVTEVTNPALYKFVIEVGKNYEIRNLSTTTSYSLNNDSSSSNKYAYSRLESNGVYYYGYSELGGIYAVKNSKTVVNGVSNQAITVYMPYELYANVITVAESANPALYSFAMEPGKNYEVRNLSETAAYSLYNDSSSSKKYAYCRLESNGAYYYGYSELGGIYAAKNSKTVVNGLSDQIIKVYMPYELYSNVITVAETANPALYKFTIEVGKNYEIRNLSATAGYALYNDSTSTNKYDYATVDANGYYSYTYSNYGSLSLPKNSKIVVNAASNQPITFYMPYELYSNVITVAEVTNAALYKFTIEPGKNYEIRNLSTTTSYSLNNDSSSTKRYDYATVDINGYYTYSTSSYGSLTLPKNSRLVINGLSDQAITVYMPYELYGNIVTVAEVTNPALYKFTMEVGKNYEIRNLSTTTSYSLNNDSSSSKKYDYATVDANGYYSYTYSTYGSLPLSKNSKVVVNAASNQPIIFYMPYELFSNVITVGETANQALYRFTIEPGKNYEIRNLSTTTSYSLNNDSSSTKKYDYAIVDANGNYSYTYATYGSLSVPKSSKIVVNAVSGQPITVYMPYELYNSIITVTEVTNPALYSFVMQPGKSYEIRNLSTTTSYSLNNDSSSTKKFAYSRMDANGTYTCGYSEYGSIYSVRNSKIVINGLSDQAITVYMPYELYNNVIIVAETVNPALYSFVMQPGKNYEIRNLSATTAYSLYNDSSYNKKYAYYRMDANGYYTYGYSEYGSLSLPKSSKTVINGLSDQTITMYMPYELYNNVITVAETANAALYNFVIEPGKNYEIRNLSETMAYSLNNDSSYTRKYAFVRVDANGYYTYGYSDYGSLSMPKSSKMTINVLGDQPVTVYMPSELYNTVITVAEIENPALYSFVMEPGKSYEIRNISATTSYTLNNNSTSTSKYDYVAVDASNIYTYDQSRYGSLYLPKNSRVIVNTASGTAISVYMPYEIFNTAVTVAEVPNPALYKFTLEVGKNYEFTNSSDIYIGIQNNSSSYQGNTFDYIKYNSSSTISSRSNTYGAIQVDKGRKTLVAVTGTKPIECYMPYSWHVGALSYKEISDSITSIYDVVPKIKLQINKVMAKSASDTLNYEIADSLLNYNFSIYNSTTQSYVYGVDVRSDVILLLGANIKAGDILKISVSHKYSQTNSFEAYVTMGEGLLAEASATVVERGYFRLNYNEAITDNRSVAALLFSSDGSYFKTISNISSSTIISDALPNGTYTVVVLKKSGYLWRMNYLSEYETCGFIEGQDYIKRAVTIQEGRIVDLGVITVPSFDEEKLSFFDKTKTLLTANVDTVLVGGLLEFRLQYKFKDQYTGSNVDRVSLKVQLPTGAILVDNSVVVDGAAVPYSSSGNSLSVNVSKKEGILRFYIKPFESNKVEVKASIKFYYNNRFIDETIGAVNVDVPYITINGERTTTTSKVKVSGIANKSKDITIFDGNNVVAHTTANISGQWTAEIELVNPYFGSVHNIYASTYDNGGVERYSNVLKIKYDGSKPKVIEFNMYYRSNKINMLEAFGSNVRPRLTFVPGSDFSFDILFENNSAIKDVFVTSTRNNEQKRMKAVYDANTGRWIASGKFDPNDSRYVPGTITVDYVLKDTELIADINETIPTTALQTQVPIEWQNADIGVVKESDGATTAQVKLGDNGQDVVNVSITTENITTPKTPEQYVAEGYTPVKQSNGTYVYSKTQYDGVTYKMSVIDIAANTVKNVALDTTVEVISKYLLDEVGGTIAGAGVSTVLDVISFRDKIINIDDARKTILNSDKSSEEKEQLLNELNDLQTMTMVYTFAKFTLTAVTVAAAVAGVAIPGAFLITCAAGFVGAVFDEWFEAKINNIESGTQGFSFAWSIDPSGYVFEAVPDNRLKNVKATAYTQNENGEPVIWNAAEFEQMNPLITDANGKYAWDVPEGKWQVKYELEGYETAYSEWLPVPPPQTEVNIGMVSLKVPNVQLINMYTDRAEISFDKYMKVSTVSEANISITDSEGSSVSGAVEPLDAKESLAGVQLAKKFIVRWPQNTAVVSGQQYKVTVDQNTESYAGVKLAVDYEAVVNAKIAPEKMVYENSKSIVYSKTLTIPIKLEPASAASGLELECSSSLSDIVSVDSISSFDETGTAYVTVTAKMVGNAALDFQVKNTDLAGSIDMSVVMEEAANAGYDIDDLVILVLAYESTIENLDGRWDARADLNKDGIVDLRDLGILAWNYR